MRDSVFILQVLIFTAISSISLSHSQDATNITQPSSAQEESLKLNCQPGEQRYFNYESSTKIWGSESGQQVRLRAAIRIRCMEAPANNTLKYLAEIMRLTPLFGNETAIQDESQLDQRAPKLSASQVDAKAEPVFEEVGEALSETASRVRRSVSGWLTKTWSSVKDFFTNIFTPNERSLVSREQAFNESGLDIAGMCRSGGRADKTPPSGASLDDSLFEDLDEPKLFYAGASVDPSSGTATSYEFASSIDQNDLGELGEDADLSFFDDPKSPVRPKRATDRTRTRLSGSRSLENEQEHLVRMPFVFVQSNLGRILEIRFSADESDLAVKNFKRHLCDLFTTNLDQTKNQLQETTPVGQHTSKYIVDQSSDSRAIKQSLTKEVGGSRERSNENNELVRALASVAATSIGPDGFQSMEGRDPSSGGAGSSEQTKKDLSVLRSINATSSIQLSSSSILPDIDRMRISVKQVQHISSGRMTGSAGQLSMSLVQAGHIQGSYKRQRRSLSDDIKDQNVDDIADLLQVFTSFQLQLVPKSRVGNFEQSGRRLKRSMSVEATNSNTAISGSGNVNNATKQTAGTKRKSEPLVTRSPSKHSQEFTQLMESLRQVESDLNLASASIVSESDGLEGHTQRLEILRDQVQMRLNEEFVRNKLRKRISSPSDFMALSQSSQIAASTQPDDRARSASQVHQAKSHDLGLSLTQLILDTGFTGKRKGSVYQTLEEIVELEGMLGEEQQTSSISKLLRETVRQDKLRAHCKSSIANADEVKSASADLHFTWPFGEKSDPSGTLESERVNSSMDKVRARNQRRLHQCRQVSELLLRAGDRQTAEMLLDLVDECNRRLLAAAKDEELGYGPVSRYYRQLRQRFTEMLASLSRPSDAFLDKLVNRLTFITDPAASSGGSRRAVDEAEFDYVNRVSTNPTSRYNKSLLSEEDDFNNSDGVGSLVMTLTTLASKSTISKSKRAVVIDRLMQITRQSQCSPLSSPDLDVLESLSLISDNQEGMVTKVLNLARRCRHVEQYLVSAVHAFQGQLQNTAVQRFFNEQLRSKNTSCTVKSEILLSLIQSIVVEDLRPIQDHKSAARERTWPSLGHNQVDETLKEIISRPTERRWKQDRKCLQTLIASYQSRKLNLEEPTYSPEMMNSKSRRSLAKFPARRTRREVPSHDFWDEANCKRWSIGDANFQAAPTSGLDDLDDSSIASAVATSERISRNVRNTRRGQRDVDMNQTNYATNMTANLNSNSTLLRRRHKCTASKSFGPKNAQATLKAEVVNDLVGLRDENKFLARFRLGTSFLGNQIDVGRMYFWYQRRTTRALVNILGKSLWDTSHSCQDSAPKHFVYMPLFDFNLWVVKVTVGLRLQAEMGFFSNCQTSRRALDERPMQPESKWSQRLVSDEGGDELELYPSISLRASGEASARFVAARAGMSLASQYGYLGNIKVSRQPESCMSIESAHQPMNVTFASWFQLWDGECHYWGSRNRAQPAATKWRLGARKPTIWLQDECLIERSNKSSNIIFKQVEKKPVENPADAIIDNSNKNRSTVLFP